VRHPDMPEAVFAHMWSHLKVGVRPGWASLRIAAKTVTSIGSTPM
jgi:hypothetical protein